VLARAVLLASIIVVATAPSAWPFTVADMAVDRDETPVEQQRFALAASTVAPGDRVELQFPVALHAARGERFWATIVQHGVEHAQEVEVEVLYIHDGDTYHE